MSDTCSKTMLAVAVTGVEEFSYERVEIPVPAAGEALVKVAFCGICGSDIPRYFNGAVHSFPQVLGHEFSGTVVSIGSGVDPQWINTNVAVAPLVPCHNCEDCLSGHPSQCGRYSFIGSRQQGALAEYVLVPARNLVRLDHLPLKLGALVEPLTVALHGISMATTTAATHALILGSGVIGLMALIALKARNVGSITMVDINPWALDMANQLGSDYVLNSAVDDVHDHFSKHHKPTLVIETAGVVATRKQALELAGNNAEVVLIGTPGQELELSVSEYEYLLRKELHVQGSWMSYSSPFPGQEWREAPKLLAEMAEDVDKLVTHVFPLEEAAKGFSVLVSPGEQRLKVMFTTGGDQS